MKFGLIIPDKKKANGSATEQVKTAKVASIFDEDDFEDDEEKELANLRRAKEASTVNITKSISTSDQFVEKLHEEALKEDPNIFDYDAVLESDDLNRKSVHRNSRFASLTGGKKDESSTYSNEPKYMQNILAKAEERKIESELIKLRNMKRKAGLNSEQTEGNEEVFVTSAYKERLKELEEKEKELKARQIREEDGDVTKRKDMTGFYYNLMKRNVSFGGKISHETEIPKRMKLESSEPEKTGANATISEATEILEPAASQLSASSESEDEQIVFGPRRPPVKK